MKRIKKVCEQCGKEFEVVPSHIGRRFCCRGCWYLWKSENWCGENSPTWKGGKAKLICERCGKAFDAYLCKKRRFCSIGCSDLWWLESALTGENHPSWKGGKAKLICEQCGKVFETDQFKKDQARFCSLECRYSAQVTRVERVCEHCGKTFEAIPSQVRAGHARFCSKECQHIFLVGENHCCWRGGISFEPYGLEFDDKLKQAIRKRDNHTCAISGDLGRCVHHINYDKIDNRPENLITLSASCHGKTNTNRDLWQALLGPIAQSREGI